jgi:2-polyprenyl-3-methyl-5-hydroxy-6-metoxy-1,4-benzoquinol methylase
MTTAMATAHRYHDWVFRSFADALRPGRTLEVGTGHGEYSRRIAERVDELIISDVDPAAVEKARRALDGTPNVRYLVMDGVDPAQLGGPVSNIVLVNVLEHIEDDGALLRRCRESLQPGGVLVVFVPAFALLFSRMDREAGHFRRYQRDELAQLIEASGFQLERIGYVNAVGFFGWLVNKWLDSPINSASTNLQVTLYDRLVPLFRRIDRLLPFFGQSLLAIAERR